MKNDIFYVRECSNSQCFFRFPAPKDSGIGVNCPKCKAETHIVHEIQLHNESNIGSELSVKNINSEVLLDNIRSTFNVGAIFRSADGVGINKIHLCGITPSPKNIKVHKTSLGSENTIKFESYPNALKVVNLFKEKGYRIWAIEKTSLSESIFNFEISATSDPTLLIVGNEIIGIDPDILKICDVHLHIPMVGLKNSLNVAIAFGIAAYSLTRNAFK
jgi:tRNA G18 (ribose-2'-O)-methylase SpoU